MVNLGLVYINHQTIWILLVDTFGSEILTGESVMIHTRSLLTTVLRQLKVLNPFYCWLDQEWACACEKNLFLPKLRDSF